MPPSEPIAPLSERWYRLQSDNTALQSDDTALGSNDTALHSDDAALRSDYVEDYFTNTVYSVGKSGAPRDVTQGNPLRPSTWGFNLRPAGGVFEHPPPCGFSRIARKRRRAAPSGFHLPYPPSFWQLLWKFRSWVMQGQVTRSVQVTIPYKNFTIAPQLQCLRESYETFGIW